MNNKGHKAAQTQLHVLVVGQDQDDVGPDVPSVSVETGLQAGRHGHQHKVERYHGYRQEEEEPSHDL